VKIADGEIVSLANALVRINDSNLAFTKKFSGSNLSELIDTSSAIAGTTIDGGGGNDYIKGSNYSDKLTTGAGNDLIVAGAGNDSITANGNLGDVNLLAGGAGNDTFTGGKGSDVFVFEHDSTKQSGVDVINGATSADSIVFSKEVYQDADLTEDSFTYIKNGNNLEIIKKSNNDKVIVKNYFSSGDKVGNLYLNSTWKDLIPNDVHKAFDISQNINKVFESATEIVDLNKVNVLINDGSGNNSLVGTETGNIDTFNMKTGGNDTITGGVGVTKIVYENANFGKDTVNIKDDENVVIDLSSFTTSDRVFVSRVGSDIKIYVDEINSNSNYILVKNYNSNKFDSHVSILVQDLQDKVVDLALSDVMFDTDIPTTLSSFTGTLLSEEIDARNTNLTKISSMGGSDRIIANNSGMTINTGVGNDTVFGGAGADTVTFGKTVAIEYNDDFSDKTYGENVYFYRTSNPEVQIDNVQFNGDDVIYLEKGADLRVNVIGQLQIDTVADGLTTTSYNEISKNYISRSRNGNDLLITITYYQKVVKKNEGLDEVVESKTGTITVKDYFSSVELAKVTLNCAKSENSITEDDSFEIGEIVKTFAPTDPNLTYNGSWYDETIDARVAGGAVTINGGSGSENILGSKYNDTLNGGVGDDTITGNAGDDILSGGDGFNTFNFNQGDGKDIITDATVRDTINITDTFESIEFIKRSSVRNISLILNLLIYVIIKLICEVYFSLS